jgi:prepilin-type N-terminal cleavage/methylation domain-containing protein
MNKNTKQAFSLIELSVVILIIGILVAGITQSSRLIRQFTLSSARSLTKSSPVASISGIVAWFETTLEESFGGVEPEEDLDGGANGIATWFDINPQSAVKNNATSPSEINNPGYAVASNNINGLPVLNLNNPTLSTQHLRFDGTSLAGSNYSVFIVEQRSAGDGNHKYIIGSSIAVGATDQALHIGYRRDGDFTWRQFQNDYNMPIATFSVPEPRIHAVVFNSALGAGNIRRYFRNGVQTALVAQGGAIEAQGLTAYTNATIGFYATDINSYYQGGVGEIIIFNRALRNEERRSVEEYLAQKWKIRS